MINTDAPKQARRSHLTICRRVQYNESGIDGSREFAICKVDSIRMAAESISGLVKVDIMVSAIESP